MGRGIRRVVWHEKSVFASEKRAIRVRRRAVQRCLAKDEAEKPQSPAPDEPVTDLVGLALSGGGMRSASFGIGILQRLGVNGLLRYVDYLSTVSGGGYAGAVLSAHASTQGAAKKREEDNPEKLKQVLCPFLDEGPDANAPDMTAGQESARIRRLVYGGDYLFRDKFAFAAQYCAGLVLNNTFLLAGIVAVAAAAAILWRSFDVATTRDILSYLDARHVHSIRPDALRWLAKPLVWIADALHFEWNSDSVRPFIPTLLCLAFWLGVVVVQVISWLKDYFVAHSPGSAKSAVRKTPASPADVRAVARWRLWTCGAAVVAFSWFVNWLVPLGLAPARHDTWLLGVVRVIAAAVFCWLALGLLRTWLTFAVQRFHQVVLVVILATFVIGVAVWLGNRDTTNSSSVWNLQNSLIPWGTLATLLLPFLRPNLIIDSATQPSHPAQRLIFVVASTALLAGGPLFAVFWLSREDVSRFAEARTQITAHDFQELPDPAHGVTRFEEQLDQDLVRNDKEINQSFHDFSQELARRLRDVTRGKTPPQDPELGTVDGKNDWRDSFTQLNEYLFPATSADASTPAQIFKKIPAFNAAEFTRAIDYRFRQQLSNWPSMSKANRERFTKYFQNFKDNDLPKLIAARDTLQASRAGDDDLTRGLLTAWYPGFVRTREFVSTDATILADQHTRAMWLLIAVGVFFVAGIAIDPNRTSIQKFYRNQIAAMFVAQDQADAGETQLHNLNTTQYGAPYHLLSGTANFLGIVKTGTAQRQEVFLFSRKFCGSRSLSYAHSRRCLPPEYGTLGNAVAVSGAALSPTTVAQPLLFAVMMVLNLRLGQWLPNPLVRNIRLTRPIRRWKRQPGCDGGTHPRTGQLRQLAWAERQLAQAERDLDRGQQQRDAARQCVGRARRDLVLAELRSVFQTKHAATAELHGPAAMSEVQRAKVELDRASSQALQATNRVAELRQQFIEANLRVAPLFRIRRSLLRWQRRLVLAPWRSVPRMFAVMVGLTRFATERPLCFVTDGGHRENLGVTQLLIRRCKLILAVDAGHDPLHRFDDLARVMRNAEIHLGVKFKELDTQGRLTGRTLQSDALDLRELSMGVETQHWSKGSAERRKESETTSRTEPKLVDQHYLLARIVYPEQTEDDYNLLVYIKPSLTGDESEQIDQYRAQNPEFPHEPTIDQDYSPAQFEAYRQLGDHIGAEITRRFSPVTAADDWWECNKTVAVDQLIDAFLERQWVLRRSPRLEDDYASVLAKQVIDCKENLSCGKKAAEILRRLHPRANIQEKIREIVEELRYEDSPHWHEILVSLGPLAVLPTLALARERSLHTDGRLRCLAVLREILFDPRPQSQDVIEYVPRIIRELERLLSLKCLALDKREVNKVENELRKKVRAQITELLAAVAKGAPPPPPPEDYARFRYAPPVAAAEGIRDPEFRIFDEDHVRLVPDLPGVYVLHWANGQRHFNRTTDREQLRTKLALELSDRPDARYFQFELGDPDKRFFELYPVYSQDGE